VNNAVFKLDAPLEAINGSANGITGTVVFDPENPAATRGKMWWRRRRYMFPIPP